MCCDIADDAAAETARIINDIGGQAISQHCDAASEEQTVAAAAAGHAAFGRLDILVSGAAPHDPSGTVLETTRGRLAAGARHQPDRLVPAEPGRAALHDRGRRRLDHLYRVADGPRRGSAGRPAYCATKGR